MFERTRNERYWLDRFNEERHCSLLLGRCLGGGLMGKVYEVSAPKISPRNWGKKQYSGSMVLKIMWTDLIYDNGQAEVVEDLESRRKWDRYYRQECRIMSELGDCEYTMPLLDHQCFTIDEDECRKVYLLLMPKLQTLEAYWKEHHGKLEEGELVKMSKDLVQALAACHELKILHRDIKPNNIYVQLLKSGGRRYILADFGCCWSFRTKTGGCGNTFANEFSAPESQWETLEKESYRRDVYQFGRMLYYLITEQDCGPVDPNNGKLDKMKPAFRHFIIKATEQEPGNRWRDGREMAAALDKADHRSGTVISVNRNYRAAKQALRGGRYDDARKIAAAGALKNEPGCALLELYCRVREYMLAPSAAELRRLNGELDDLLLSGEGNYAALCLSAILAAHAGDREKARMDMKDSADSGFVPAGYLWGRMLYDDPADAGERKVGIRYIQNSAENGYWDALHFAQEYLRNVPMSDGLRRKLAELDLVELGDPGVVLQRARMHRDSVAAYL